MRGILASTLVLLLAAGALPLPASGQDSAVGVVPATLSFVDPPLLPGGSKVGVLHFQQRYDDSVEAEIAVEGPSSQVGNARTWLTLSHSGEVSIPPTNDFPINVTVRVPETAADGTYEAGVRFKVRPPSSGDDEGSGATTETAVTAIVRIEVDNENQVQRVEVEDSPDVYDAEVGGRFQFTVPLANTGNVDANPRVRISVQDKFQESVVATFWFNDTLLAPGEARAESFVLPRLDLPIDQYWGVVEVFLGNEVVFASGAQAFNVLAPGSLARSATLRTLLVEGGSAFAEVGQLLKISAMVVNTGQAPLVARFKGEVHRDGELVDTIASDPIEVPIGAERALEVFYRAAEAGRHEFKGRVHYGADPELEAAKVTEEKSLIITTAPGQADVPWLWIGLVALFLVAAGGVFAVLRRRGGTRGAPPAGRRGRRGPPAARPSGGRPSAARRPGQAPRRGAPPAEPRPGRAGAPRRAATRPGR